MSGLHVPVTMACSQPTREASQAAVQSTMKPGMLVTHDWTHLHTGRALRDTTVRKAGSQVLQTDTFPITSASQYQAFVSGRITLGVENVKGCPVQLVPDQCNLSPDSPVNAFVKVTYQVTHEVAESQGTRLSDDAIKTLRLIEQKLFDQKDKIPEDDIDSFLKLYGSHFQQGGQLLGKCFNWMVMVDRETNTSMLQEIADEIFGICETHEKHLLASHEGIWYSPRELIDTSSWSEKKKQLLASAKLRVSHSSSTATVMSLKQWKENPDAYVHPLYRINDASNNITSAWDFITKEWKQFQRFKKLAAVIKDGWIRLVERTQHTQLVIPSALQTIDIPGLGNPWNRLVKDLGLVQHFPCKLVLQTVRSLHVTKAADPVKKDLPWRVLEQMILMHVECREQAISNFARTVKLTNAQKKKLRKAKAQDPSVAGDIEAIPHPMDMVLLLLTCSDFMLRQVLARKLSMCRLAIPFIVPTPEDSVEMLLWPLRSIVMEWRTEHEGVEEALVNCNINMVAFMRSGPSRFSKSKLLNDLLAHTVFFHQEAPCGNEKRTISNGTVEMTHLLPAGKPQDKFTKPALFFNLRGDACDYPVQEGLLLDLATVVVCLVDIGELGNNLVQQNLKGTAQREQKIIFILTDDKKHNEGEIEQLQEQFLELVDNAIDESNIVTMFEMDGSQKNMSDVEHEVRDIITQNMEETPQQSLESYVARKMSNGGGSSVAQCCTVDEIRNRECSTGKEVALDLLLEMEKVDICERKSKLLPQQGDCLLEIGKLLRKLHRSSSKDAAVSHKEEIKQNIKQIRKQQSAVSRDDRFTMKVISLFHYENGTKEFAIKWVQLKLDAISRAHLPKLQNEKNKKWDELTKARNEENARLVQQLESQVVAAEKKVAAATCGWEHLMREMGQLYEVALELKQLDRKGSMFPLSDLPEILGRQLLEGQPVELMDGDHGFLPAAWIKAVFSSLARLAGHDKKIFVLSVIGIQSSGKSTLLNTMFGLEFAVSAGRCTRGIYAQLLPATNRTDLPFDYMLVLDSEGLRAHELGEQNFEHDNELATLVIDLADLALINIKGENVTEMAGVLQIVVHAFLRMKLADSPHKRKCMFVHQNVSSVNAQEKLAVDRQKLQEQLNNMTKEASIAQGLAETITSFNRIISFDSHGDVVYFADLWHGNPPMATVNQGYSIQAAETQQRILAEIRHNFNSCITVADFISRVEDMWKGVLSDDFIFSFRSTLAAKAYIEVEREIARLALQIEQDILKWVNSHCKIQIANCKSENDLHRCCESLKVELKAKLTELITRDLKNLQDFFDKHIASEIINQWKSEKMAAFRMFSQSLERQTETDLENIKVRKLFELRQKTSSRNHEQEIIKKAIAFAEIARGKHPTDAELDEQFGELWRNWLADMTLRSPKPPCNIQSAFENIIYEKMSSEGHWQAFQQQVEVTPLKSDASINSINIREVTKDHIILKEKPFSLRGLVNHPSRSEHLPAAVEKANIILKTVVQEIESLCKQDSMFHPLHGKQIIELTLGEVIKHNRLLFEQSAFSFTPPFRALLVIRAVSYSIPRFEEMNQRYEAKHGIQAQMEPYKGRVFLLFKNTMNETSAEVTASEDFCETIKAKLVEYIKMDVEQNVLKHIYQAVGSTKYDLITKMLDQIVQQERFMDLHEYVTEPFVYATFWLQRYGEQQIFTHRDGQTRYGEFAERTSDSIFSTVVASATSATRSVSSLPSSEQYGAWIAAFCDNMNETVPLDPAQLSVATSCTITSFTNFQNFLETQLQMLSKNINEEFKRVTEESVGWLDSTNPFLKVRNRLWGCTEMCPFCWEPCQDSDPNHQGSHRCVQHRPAGIRGTQDLHTKVLIVETCSLLVTSKEASFSCDACSKQCRSTEHCTAMGRDKNYHPYQEYKKYLPDWDVAPDPAGEASKYWQWAMCTFQDQLLAMYDGAQINIPDSWKETTKQDAIDSLRVFH